MAASDVGRVTGVRWTDWEAAAAAQESGRAAIVLAQWQSPDAGRQAVKEIVSRVFRAAPGVRSAHEWAERIVELHYRDEHERQRHFSVQALRLYTLQGVRVGWNTALSVLLMGDGLVSNAVEGAAAQRYADEIFLAVVRPDPEWTAGAGSRQSRSTSGSAVARVRQ